MDQYQRANAVEKVDGYFLRIHPTMTAHAEFLKAQAECLRHLRAQIEHIEKLSFAQFAEAKKIKADTNHE